MMEWFPQQYAQEFNTLKALVAFFATILLIIHMQQIWPSELRPTQRLRYVVLLGYAMNIVFASISLARSDSPVQLYNLFSLLLTILLVVVTTASIRSYRRSGVP